jgi:cellulose synthase/poly-beta-1,6-N-acetylglucosamine synthase-like glycosyltransferase
MEKTRLQVEDRKQTQSETEWILAPEGRSEFISGFRLAHTHEGIHVVIMARNEAAIIGATVRALMMGIGSEDQIHVVADHCQDGTARNARKAGATVHIRQDGGPAGKGQALKWWLDATRDVASPDEMIVILDADSLVAPNFFESLRERMERGENVIQTRVEPVLRTNSPVSSLAAYSESTEQRVNDALRARLGWSVRLRGTGMAFRRQILERICAPLHTLVEDVEMTIQLGAEGEKIHFAHETYIADPKPNDKNGAMRQRARWMKGQMQVAGSYFKEIIRLLARGPAGWSLLNSVLLKPKTLLIPLKILLTMGAWAGAILWGGMLGLFAAIGTMSLLYDMATFTYGVKYAPDREEALRSLALSPLYLIMWIRSLALSSISGNTWHRVRPINPDVPISDRGIFERLEHYLKVRHNPRALAVQPVPADGGD